MRFRKALLFAPLLALLCTGCGTAAYNGRVLAPVVPAQGAIFSDISGPLTTNYKATPVGGKQGQASTYYFRVPFLSELDFSWDDASTQAAARNGGITKVQYADYHALQVLDIFGKFTVTVYGE